MKTFYATSPGTGDAGNFGDELMRPLLNGLFDVEPVYVSAARAELIGVGSILDAYHRKLQHDEIPVWRRRPWRQLHVWGSGFMAAGSIALWPQTVAYHAVRGPLSAARIVPDTTLAHGDPGLLLPLLWPHCGPRDAAVGIVPHFVTLAAFRTMHESDLPEYWRVINLLDAPERVAGQIAACDFIVSSSLHGLIAADAYGVPSVWMKPHTPIKGDGFKFEDYFAFRGAAIPGPIDFREFLAAPRGLMNAQVGARPAAREAIDRLVAAFPFR